MPSAISTTDLTKHYAGVRALEGLTLDVPQGSIYGFLGANGAGKTTALKILAGLTRPTSGSATVAGVPLAAGESYKRAIGYLGQEPRFYDWMTGARDAPLRRRLLPLGAGSDRASDRRGPRADGDRGRRRSPDRDLLRRDAPAARHRPGPHRQAAGAPARRAGQRARPDRPARRPRPHGRPARRRRRSSTPPTSSTTSSGSPTTSRSSTRGASSARRRRRSCSRSFTRDRLRVVVAPCHRRDGRRSRRPPGRRLRRARRSRPRQATFLIQARAGQTDAVQRAVTRYAVESDLTLVTNCPRDGRSRRGLPPAHRLQGACRMNAMTLDPAAVAQRRPRPAAGCSASAISSGRTSPSGSTASGRGSSSGSRPPSSPSRPPTPGSPSGRFGSFPADPGDGPAKVLSVLPIDNLLFAIGTQFIVLAAIFATMSLLIAERDSGTLAWTISKPVSRTSVLVSKWLTATLVLWVAAVVIPLAVTTVLVTVLYGLPDLADRASPSASRSSRCRRSTSPSRWRRRRSSRARPPSARSASPSCGAARSSVASSRPSHRSSPARSSTGP